MYSIKEYRGRTKKFDLCLLLLSKEILNEHPDNHNYGVDRILLALLQKGIDVS